MKEILSKLLPVVLICAAVLLLLAACSQDESINQWEEDTLCTPEPFQFTEEELSCPTPPGLEYQYEEYRKNWRKWKAVGSERKRYALRNYLKLARLH